MKKKQQIKSEYKLAFPMIELNKVDSSGIKNQLTHRSKDKYKKILSDLQLILEGQKINQKDLKLGFVTLATQNSKLINSNKQLTQQLKRVVEELNVIKKEREKKSALKEARANRKRLPKRQPITPEIYRLLIQTKNNSSYTSVRLRIVFCLLTVTGIRISELLPLKVHQLETLRNYHWIAIDRSKRGPNNHKAFLTREGKNLVKDRRKDFEFLFLMKDHNSYVFTSENKHDQMLSREAFTREVNKVMRSVSESLPNKPYITSHSFRIGYVSQLWKDTKDIEFVKQSIGHIRMDTTSSYVDNLSDQERQKRMSKVNV